MSKLMSISDSDGSGFDEVPTLDCFLCRWSEESMAGFNLST